MTLRVTLLSLALAVSCTYNEYTTINESPTLSDAGSSSASAGRGGAAGAGRGGDAGSAVAQGGAGNGGGGAVAAPCTGCARITIPGTSARLELPFEAEQDLRDTLVTFRVRVASGGNGVYFSAFARSGNDDGEELILANVRLDPTADWQEIGFDSSTIEPFRSASFIDSGVGGAGFDPGNPFDKTEIEAIGFAVASDVPTGVFTASTIELDAIRFSSHPELDVLFSAAGGGVELVDSGAATLDIVTL